MHAVKAALIKLLKSKLNISTVQTDREAAQLDDEKLADICFFRTIGSNGGFRLTDTGLEFFGRFFENWKINLSDITSSPWDAPAGMLRGKVNNGNTLQVVQLDRYFNSPWFLAVGFYYKEPHIVVFEPNSAMRLKLCQGDLSVFLKKAKKV